MEAKDYGLFKKLISLTQEGVRKSMTAYLESKYNNVISTEDYVVAIGNIPIALVAHMDTVYAQPATQLFYDVNKGIFWNPKGLGADDRAGIFAIIKIIQSGFRPSIILTTNEEVGGLGAYALSKNACPIPDLRYMIELDRQGTNDCVFYDCYCPDFVDYVESFGFKERQGSFSDISILMPAWKICGVNLSVGYKNEHSAHEFLIVEALYDTIEKVKKMLTKKDIPIFEYDEVFRYQPFGNLNNCCHKCKKAFFEYELFPVKNVHKSFRLYCPDCIASNAVEWCKVCQEPYEADSLIDKVCKNCAEGVCTKTLKSSSEM